MFISGLKLVNFRNYKELEVDLDSDITVLYGKNAQGKTNILESLFVCSCLRSHRTHRDSELIFHGENEYRIYLDYYETDPSEMKPSFSESLSVFYFDSVAGDQSRDKPRRYMEHNGMSINKSSEMVGIFKAVIFAPEDLSLIKDGPAIRRRFLDILISQIRPSYFNELVVYQKILSNRNALLKQMRDGEVNRDHENIVMWDEAFADSAAKIILTRSDFVEKIEKHASKQHKKISSEKEEIYVKYKTISGISLNKGVEAMADKILKKLKGNFYEDIERGSTSQGPHRDDLEMMINGRALRIYASQGQQRTAVLALKMAELEIIREETQTTPVLLLDDVMSELDDSRRKLLLSSIGSAQVILTCTEAEHVPTEFFQSDSNKTIHYYEVTDGRIKSVDMV